MVCVYITQSLLPHKNNNKSASNDNNNVSDQIWHTLFKIQDLCMDEKYKGKPHLVLYFHFDQNIWKNHNQTKSN